ncbi:hypothetical protein [Streptomyces sp. NBC_01618]|uniref:hypothetical protein n=1 Tax=Streptomyces sp. NBC_01618 TaxID=2975900 RepID=UPI003864FBF1|nr:hypothetical protein OH735_29965 [Streptomyces sp. NBC_01618]
MTNVTVTGSVALARATALLVSGLFALVLSCGAAAEGAIAVMARTAAVAAPSAVRDIGRAALSE